MRRFFQTAAALCLTTTAASAQVFGFCGNYQQVSSNAGDCLECRLMIADNPEIQAYFVEANNNWSAELHWLEGDSSVAEGTGQWGNVGGAYDRQTFDIDLVQQGDLLDMRMTHHSANLGGTIEARYICRD